jgi:DNA-binding response OmpR family regulator
MRPTTALANIASDADRRCARGTILIVDDDDLVRSAMTRVLRRADYDVCEIAAAHDALSMLQRGARFDLLITDVTLSESDATDLVSRVRQLECDQRFLFTTRTRRESDFWASCASHVLLKPFHSDELVERVRERLVSVTSFVAPDIVPDRVAR